MNLPVRIRKKRIKIIKQEINACDNASNWMTKFLELQAGTVIRHAVIGLLSTVSVSVMGLKVHKQALEADLRKEQGNVKRIQSLKRLRASRK